MALPDKLRKIPGLRALAILAMALPLFLMARQLGALGSDPAAPAPPLAPGFEPTGQLQDPALVELSGLARSRTDPQRFWGINDSGNAAELFALDARGQALGRVAVGDSFNRDWEDLASYRDPQGRAWLAIADTGDNRAIRDSVQLLLVPEPAPDAGLSAVPQRLRFRWPDGPRDCESLAVDLPGQRFLLLDKGRRPRGIYALPMAAVGGDEITAERLGDLPLRWDPRGNTPEQRFGGALTAMDLSDDGQRMAVLSYRALALFERRAGEDWPQRLQRAPDQLFKLPKPALFESLSWLQGESGLLVAPEGKGATLYRHRLGTPDAQPAAPPAPSGTTSATPQP
jgi:hypothetical protein